MFNIPTEEEMIVIREEEGRITRLEVDSKILQHLRDHVMTSDVVKTYIDKNRKRLNKKEGI